MKWYLIGCNASKSHGLKGDSQTGCLLDDLLKEIRHLFDFLDEKLHNAIRTTIFIIQNLKFQLGLDT